MSSPRPSFRLHIVVALLVGAIAKSAWDQEIRRRRRAAASGRLLALRAALTPSSLDPPVVEPPPDLPQRSLGDLGRRVYGEIWNDRVLSVAAGVTFYALLAIFPTLAALVSLYGLVADPVTISQHLGQLYFFLPGGAVEVIGGQVSRITAKPSEALGATLAVSLVLSLWSANAGMKALFDALNIVHGLRETRSFVRLTVQTLTFTLGAITFLLLALAGVVVVPAAIAWIGLDPEAERLLSSLRWPAMATVLVAGLAILYRWAPCRPRPASGRRWPGIAIGSVAAAVTWIAASMLFSFYVANFADYNQTYGSLGAAIGFMTWIWLSAIIIVVGGEIDAEIERAPPW